VRSAGGIETGPPAANSAGVRLAPRARAVDEAAVDGSGAARTVRQGAPETASRPVRIGATEQRLRAQQERGRLPEAVCEQRLVAEHAAIDLGDPCPLQGQGQRKHRAAAPVGRTAERRGAEDEVARLAQVEIALPGACNEPAWHRARQSTGGGSLQARAARPRSCTASPAMPEPGGCDSACHRACARCPNQRRRRPSACPPLPAAR
jgi:hypothetical protein